MGIDHDSCHERFKYINTYIIKRSMREAEDIYAHSFSLDMKLH